MKKEFFKGNLAQYYKKNINKGRVASIIKDEKSLSFLITPSTVRAKQLPPSIKQWINGIYSFNKNYIKTIPSLDIMVNKIIKSFFTINPLAYNPGGKKSKLLKRRFKRLSLNRILVGKPEIKHTNNNVYITVYVFNKKKNSLIYKLKQLYNNVSFSKLPKLNNYKNKQEGGLKNLYNSTYNMKHTKSTTTDKNTSSVAINSNHKNIKQGKINIPSPSFLSVFTKDKTYIYNYTYLFNRYKRLFNKIHPLFILKKDSFSLKRYIGNIPVHIPVQGIKKISSKLYKNNNNKKTLYSRINLTLKAKNRIYRYKVLNNLTKIKAYRFIKNYILLSHKQSKLNNNISVLLKKNPNIAVERINTSNHNFNNLILKKLMMKNYYYALNKYKLYKGKFEETKPSHLLKNKYLVKSEALDNIILSRHHMVKEKLYEDPKKLLPTSKLYNILKLRSNVTPSLIHLAKTRVARNNSNLSYKENQNSASYHKEKFNLYLSTSLALGLDNERKIANNIITDFTGRKALDLKYNISYLRNNKKFNKGKLYISMYKLKALYKLFTLHSDIKYSGNTLFNSIDNKPKLKNTEFKYLNDIALIYNKIILNTYKLLKYPVTNYTMSNNVVRNLSKPLVSKTNKNKINQNTIVFRNFKFSDLKKNLSLKHNNFRTFGFNTVKKVSVNRTINKKDLILINKMKKIDRFINKYKNTLEFNKKIKHQNNLVSTASSVAFKNNIGNNERFINEQEYEQGFPSNAITAPFNVTVNNISVFYKLKFLKDILEKEIVYLYYIKMLSFNNTIFKSWFLNPLKIIVSKLYNKKVVLNFINLKYIHLNSDIISQAIAVRLKDFKKNRLNKVLRKVLKLVAISRVNTYANDIHNPIYKYLDQHFAIFKTLNTKIFNDLNQGYNVTKKQDNYIKQDTQLTPYYSPINIKWLNHVQSSTINFIKYKSVFGIRLEASGRLTKRSTASRAIFKLRYKGSLRNSTAISRTNSSTIIKANRISNIQFTKISSKTRNGSFGLKGWINNN